MENETEIKFTKFITYLVIGAWLWFAVVAFLLFGCTCTVNLSNNNASGHGVEKNSESTKKEVETKVDSEVEGKGSLFGF
jgi:outer membrane biogenesis lipoprotein LolB